MISDITYLIVHYDGYLQYTVIYLIIIIYIVFILSNNKLFQPSFIPDKIQYMDICNPWQLLLILYLEIPTNCTNVEYYI